LTPTVAPHTAYARLSAALAAAPRTARGVMPLDPVGPGAQLLPFEDPAAAEGACLFDSTKGLLRLTAIVDGENFLSLSFHTASGETFHTLADRAAAKGRLDVVVGDARQIEELEAEDTDETPVEEIRVKAPSLRGFALIRALAKRPSDFERARASVEAVSCVTEEP
jgi:uncharacterized membrane protein